MKESAGFGRRAFLTTVAAVTATGAGSAVAATGQDVSTDTRRSTSTAARSVEDYANRAGRVGTEGLETAFDDYNAGRIGNDLLDEVIAAWNDATRVVEKTVVELTDDVDSDTTLQRNPDDPNGEAVVYQVQNSIDVGARLTIEAGAVVEFTQATRLTVDSEAAVLAEGTAQDPILFTATNPRRGWWDGVAVNSGNPDSSMEHVTVEYGGNGLQGDVVVGDGATVSLSNCTLRRSKVYGLVLQSGSELQNGSGENRYAYNRTAPAYARTGTIHHLSASSSFTDNDDDHVYADSESVSGEGSDVEERTWAGLEVPYRMDGEHKVSALDLTVDAGATFEFTEASGLHLASDCRFTVVGRDPDADEAPTSDDVITFTGTEPQRGWWNGIYVSSALADNVFRRVIVEYGGNGEAGNLALGDRFREAATCEIKSCTFRHADGYGMVTGGSQATSYANNVTLDEDRNLYTDNAAGPVRIHTSQIHYLSSGSDFTGNDVDEVYVANGENANADNVDEAPITWSAINVPYHMDDSEHWVDLDLTVEPGAEFRFEEEGLLGFDNDAVMTIEGKEGAPIRFTGTQEQRGWWDGIYVQSEADNNTMRFVIVEYGGNGEAANLALGDRFRELAELSITDCTFSDADGYGMILGGGEGTGYTNDVTLHEMDRNLYTRNADGPASINTPQVHYLSESSDFTGNDTDEVYVQNGQNLNEDSVDPDSVTWSSINVPYRFDGSTHAVDNVELTVEPGVTCTFEEQARVRFKENSRMTIEGTESEPITFTAAEDVPGWWDGISVQSPSLANTMDYVVVRYGGRDLAGNVDMAETGFREDAALTLTNSTLSNSRAAGLYVNEGEQINQDVCEVNTFADNQGGDCVVEN